jgi:hypothetical protein
MTTNSGQPLARFVYAAVAVLISFAFLIEIAGGGCPVP